MIKFLSAIVLNVLFIMPLHAAPLQYYGDWYLDNGEKYAEAFTRNSSGSLTGELCSKTTGKCLMYLQPERITCQHGQTIDLLMSTDSGGGAVETVCSRIGDKAVMVFKNYSVIHRIYTKESAVGYALALKNGNFKAIRFSLRGSGSAIQRAEQAAVSAYRKNTNTGDRSF